MDNERRTYTRIATSLPAFMRMAESPHMSPGFRGGFHTGTEPLKEALQKTSFPAPLLDYLEAMNTKLDTILGLLHQTSLQTEYPLTATISQISGAGIQFSTPSPLQVDDTLEFVITLSHFPLHFINAIGSITRKESLKSGSPLWIFEFTNIRDTDREAIIQYVFREQREMIRGEKL